MLANGLLPQWGRDLNLQEFRFAKAFLQPDRVGEDRLAWNRKRDENNESVLPAYASASISDPLNLKGKGSGGCLWLGRGELRQLPLFGCAGLRSPSTGTTHGIRVVGPPERQ